jgi:hypothetical protein
MLVFHRWIDGHGFAVDTLRVGFAFTFDKITTETSVYLARWGLDNMDDRQRRA